ncbi:O-antigen ligase family protein [Brevundimonas sp. NPDC092305]|uniref:O-antigen ligase family protein n=1 Tax=Brevundimonas sp. NPDC092305 TaxID=3363957 RepID=UPI003812AF91
MALFAGGASRLHELRLALVELAALPVLVLAISKLLGGCPRPTPLAMLLIFGTAALPLVQLIPLPPSVWTALPGRDQAALALELSGLQPSWSALSFAPDKTWRSFLALLPPIAMFIGVGLSGSADRGRLVHIILGFAVLSIVLATAQVASGGDQLYLWPTTSPGTVVGFFANRNHLATLCLLTMPLAAVMGARVLRRQDRSDKLTLWLSILFICMMVLSLGVIRSRMGVVLLVPTLAGSILAAWIASGGGRPKPLLLGLVGGATVAVGAIVIFALTPLLARFDTAGVREGRFENWPIVAEAANTYLPLGSGLGSFDAVYRSVEPLELLDSTFFNQAHNEYLEIWLETGWLGAALICVFLVWFIRRSWTAWRARPGRERDIQRAASIGIGVVLLHSAVDYPLRTETIAVIVAMMCALLDMAARSDEELTVDMKSARRRQRAD